MAEFFDTLLMWMMIYGIATAALATLETIVIWGCIWLVLQLILRRD